MPGRLGHDRAPKQERKLEVHEGAGRSVIAGKSEMYTVRGVSGQCEHFLLLQASLEIRYRVQKCAGEWSDGSAQRGEGEGAEHLGCVLCLEGSIVTEFILKALHDKNVTVSQRPILYWDLRQNTERYYKIHFVLLPICTVATAVKAIRKYCSSVLDVAIQLILLSPVTVQAAVCVRL
jgi:hypothetical protein